MSVPLTFFVLGGGGELQVIKLGFPSFFGCGEGGRVRERESNDPAIIAKNSSIELGVTMSYIPVIYVPFSPELTEFVPPLSCK